MQVVIKAVSSRVEDFVLIEVHTTIGESTSSQRAGYSAFELEESRYMTGTLEERIETLRKAAQDTAEASIKAQIAVMMAYQKEPLKAPSEGLLKELLAGSDPEEIDRITLEAERHVNDHALVPQEPVKKPRKPRTGKSNSEKTA